MSDVKSWIKKIENAEKKYAPYHELIDEIRSYYRNEKSKNKQNIFWATVETLKPFLYFKEPKPYVEQKEKTQNGSATIACRILEKALRWDLEQFDFDSVMKYVRNDFLLLGFGVAYERYVPTFKKCIIGEGKEKTEVEILDDEKLETVYVNPKNFIADSDKVDVWEDCSWVARKIFMTLLEAKEQFGENVFRTFSLAKENDDDKSLSVYEIWDKTEGEILYVSKEYPADFLKVVKQKTQNGSFCWPKPLFATLTNEGLIPVPDYEQLKPLLDELSGVTTRMQLAMQAIKVSGCYDNSFPELANILNKDVTLVALSDFDRLKDNGGLKGIMDFAPIEQYVNALQMLALRRQDIMEQIYEMTGVSDIMRGLSDKTETATAVIKKTNFGSLRNQDRQNDMLRFITDLYKIKAEMICEHFSVDHLKAFADEGLDEKEVELAVCELKTNKLRGLILGVDTDAAYINEDLKNETQNTIGAIHQLIVQAFDVVSSQPLLLDVYKQMIESLVTTLPNARMYEPVIHKVFDAIKTELNEQDVSTPNLAMLQLKQQEQKILLEHQIKEKEVAIKEAEIVLKKNEQERKAALENKEMELQAALKNKALMQEKKTDANVTTGYVKGF